MARAQVNHRYPGLVKLAALVVAGVGLYAAREVCVPLALAGLLCFLLSQPASRPAGTQSETTASQPQAIEVKVQQPRPTGIEMLRNVVMRATSTLAMLGLVLLLTFFMLMQREDLRDRAIRLMGKSHLHL